MLFNHTGRIQEGVVTNNNAALKTHNGNTVLSTQAQIQQSPKNPEGAVTNDNAAPRVHSRETKFYTDNNYKSEETSCIAEIAHNRALGEHALSIISLISIISIILIINIINIIRGHKDLIPL